MPNEYGYFVQTITTAKDRAKALLEQAGVVVLSGWHVNSLQHEWVVNAGELTAQQVYELVKPADAKAIVEPLDQDDLDGGGELDLDLGMLAIPDDDGDEP